MKPDWKDAPAWASYLAQDADGAWFWYSTEPEVIPGDNLWSYGGTYKRATKAKAAWKETLERRP